MLKIYFNDVFYGQVLLCVLAAEAPAALDICLKASSLGNVLGGGSYIKRFDGDWLKMSSCWTGKATSGALVESNSVEIITVITCFHVSNSWMISLPSLTFCQVIFFSVLFTKHSNLHIFFNNQAHIGYMDVKHHHVCSQLCVRFLKKEEERHL